jgi:glycosyltransferase involved in cell wall biosynthesis
VELGHRLDAFVPSTADENYLPLMEAASSVARIGRPRPPDRERALEGGISPLDPIQWLRYLRLVRASERETARMIDDRGYNLVLVGASQFTQAPWVLRWLRTPTLYYCQEPLRAAYEPRISGPIIRTAIRHTLGRVDRRNARAATRVAVNSRFSAGRIGSVYHRSVDLNYLGVDTERFRPLAGERGDFVLSVAALHPLKGLDFLIDSIATIPSDDRPPLLMVSDRSRKAERRRLEAAAAGRDVEIRFEFRISEDNLVLLYNRARLVLYAPHDEPFGFVPLEAMACGRPVLGVREGGIPETIVEGETGYLAERDPVRFGARVREILKDRPGAEALGARAAEVVRTRWTWERSVHELAALCADTAADRRKKP